MCGIAGVRRFGPEPITPEEIKTLLMSLEHRGNHATGIALMSGGQIRIFKAPEPAFSFCARPEVDSFLDEFTPEATIALLHTRYATQGNPSNNANNHPMFMGNSAVVHNGGISNESMLFSSLKAERSCATDSDIFRAEFDTNGLTREALTDLNRLSGSAAIAAVANSDPEHLILARSGSPLCYATSPTKLWWASEMQAIHKALRPWTTHHGLPARANRTDVSFYAMPDDSAYILGPEGYESKQAFKLCAYYRKPNYNMRGTYHQKQAEFKADAKKKAKPTQKSHLCPWDNCQAWPMIPLDRKFADFTCYNCKRNLRQLDTLSLDKFTLTA